MGMLRYVIIFYDFFYHLYLTVIFWVIFVVLRWKAIGFWSGGEVGISDSWLKEMKAGSAAKLIVDALLQRFLPLARRRIETAQAQVGMVYFHSEFWSYTFVILVYGTMDILVICWKIEITLKKFTLAIYKDLVLFSLSYDLICCRSNYRMHNIRIWNEMNFCELRFFFLISKKICIKWRIVTEKWFLVIEL